MLVQEMEKHLNQDNLQLTLNYFMEIEMNNSFQFDSDIWNGDNFFTIYLIIHFVIGDLNGAKYLWKRAPQQLKDSGLVV